MKAIIKKGYARKLSAKYQSEEFVTNMEKEIEYTTKEELVAEHAKLAAQVKSLTVLDMEKHSQVLKVVSPGDPALLEERTV